MIRLAQQFERQQAETIALADLIENAGNVTLEVE
jgi:hypothetical protein